MNENIDSNLDDSKQQQNSILRDLESEFQNIYTKNNFPLSIYPKELQTFITELKNTSGFAIDYTASTILVAVSVAIGNKIQLKFKENWIEKSTLYLILIGRTGDIKSPAMRFCLQPLLDYDKKQFNENKAKRSQSENINPEEKNNQATPTLKQLLLSDATPEAMVRTHYNNPRGIGIYTDEIASFFKNFNRYSKGSDEELFLSSWSGNPIIKTRIGEGDLRIDNTKIDIIGTTQEAILSDFLRGSILNNGFIDRLLFSIPDTYFDNKWNMNQLDPKFKYWYHEYMNNIINYCDDNEQIIQFSDEAKLYINNWQNNRSTQIDFEHERSTIVKLEQYTIRFCLLLHAIHSLCNSSEINSIIETETVKNAIKLRDYFYFNSLRVHNIITSDHYEKMPINQQKLYDSLNNVFSTKDALDKAETGKFMKRRNVMYFLKNNKLFKKIEHGKYEKLII